MQFVVISVSGGKKKKLPLGVSLPSRPFNSSFPKHLSWEAPQRRNFREKTF